ncbi:MAG: ABC transporter substrate-binding protein [Treponema sp.]|jgi:peptide/nickel transport system substrate-binding protein|nr:ABC transporter substrate-binding protein [Treponema sp.]
MRKAALILLLFPLSAFFSCVNTEEYSLDEIEAMRRQDLGEVVAKTLYKPWQGEDFVPGRLGGAWNAVIPADPKSFNILVGEQDSSTAGIVRAMQDYLVDYDTVSRQWKPRCAGFEIVVDQEAEKLDIIYTLRDDLYWTYSNSDEKIPVTSDDVIFWYNEIEGDPEAHSSGYNGQFLVMPDDSSAHIDIEKIDDRRFVFHFPRIVADPLLTTNRSIAPRLDYQAAKRERGIQGVLDLFSIATDPKKIPSMGKYYLTGYTAGMWLVFERNPHYWEKDGEGLSVPFYEKEIVRIVADENTRKLLFQNGDTDSYSLRPEDTVELVNGQGGKKRWLPGGSAESRIKPGTSYTVFNGGASLGANFWSFNQNPVHAGGAKYEWFTQKEFRQAMSRLLNRERIIAQVYRGLADPKLDFFPEPNAFYNRDIRLKYTYNPAEAARLLASIGIVRDGQGIMRDRRGRAIEFDLTIRSESGVMSDIASIIRDDLERAGIKLNIRILDFQKMVEQLFYSFEWDSLLIGLSGSDIFPTQGSNVWPSDGNLHLWYPLQENPATEWEARIDYLYNEAAYTIDREKAKAYWDEYQSIFLEQCPVIYLVRPRLFAALNSRWDQSNVYYDNINGFETTHMYLGYEEQ